MSATKTKVQLSAEELQQVKWLLGAVVTLVSVATVFYLDVEAWTLLALTAGVVLAGLWRPAWLARVPVLAHRLAFPFIAAFFTGDLWLSGELLPAMVRLDILLLLYRSLIYRQRRDDLQVIVLGLFLVVVAGVLSVSLTFAVHILTFTAVALLFLLVITLAGGSPGPAAAGRQTDGAPEWARSVRWRGLPGRVRAATDWRVLALGGGLFAGLVALSALLFLAIPRFQLENSFFLERFITKKARTGFSETIRFGDVTEITQDNRVALTVDVSDRSQIPASPYWRMLVLDEYREGTFRLSPVLRARGFGPEQGRMSLPGGLRGGVGEPARWTFYLESGVSRYLPLLGRFELLQFRERQNHRFASGLGVVALREEPVTMTAYRVVNLANGATLPDRGFAAQLRERTALSGMMTRVGVDESDRAALERVVAEIAGGKGIEKADTGNRPQAGSSQRTGEGAVLSAEAFARRAEAWLTARHAYSLQPAIPEGAGDPLVRWLTSGESGHCELFAGSFVLLARAAGLPARVVTGFRGGSWNGFSDNFTLRNSDAHAWCEVYDAAAQAWLRADPTPGAAVAAQDETQRESALARRMDRSWTARLESLRVFWYRRIVSFDQQSQLETLRSVKEAAEKFGERLRAALSGAGGELRSWLTMPWGWRRMGALGAGVLVVVAFGWAIRNFRFWILDFRFGAQSRVEVVRAEAGRWLGRWRALRAEQGEASSEQAEEAAVRERLERLRYGARETWPEPAVVFRAARRVIRAAKRQRAGRR